MQQNRYPEAIIAANGTSTSITSTSSYAVGVGELAFSTDTKQVYVAGSLTGGDFLRVLTETSPGVASISSSFSTPLLIGNKVRLGGYTVSTLPSGVIGDTVYCTDLLTPTFLAVAVGGGAVVGKVFFDGTNWIT